MYYHFRGFICKKSLFKKDIVSKNVYDKSCPKFYKHEMTIFLFSQNLKNNISRVKNTSLKGSQKHEAFFALELHSWDFVIIKYNLSLNCNNADKLYYNNYYLIFDLFYHVLFRSLSEKQKLYPFPVKDVLAIKSKIEENNVSDGTPPFHHAPSGQN